MLLLAITAVPAPDLVNVTDDPASVIVLGIVIVTAEPGFNV